MVIEGNSTDGAVDELLVQLAAAPALGTVVACASCSTPTSDAGDLDLLGRRPLRRGDPDAQFTTADWDNPVRLVITPRDNALREDPRTAVIEFALLERRPTRPTSFPSPYAPPARVAVEVLDDETAGAVVLESGGSTLVVRGGATDDYSCA